MTIKQQGGIFGRNPTFNDVDVEGTLTVNGEPISDFGTMAQQDADSVNIDGGAIDAVTLGTNSPVTEMQVDNININGNTISSTNTNGSVTIDPDGTGFLNVQLPATAGVPEAIRITNPQNAGTFGDGSMISFQNTSDSNRSARIESFSRGAYGQSTSFRFMINNGSAAPRNVFQMLGDTGHVYVTEGNLLLSGGGNVVMNSGAGIDFSATSDGSGTSTSELFSDYEEGSWTPQFSVASGTLTTNASFSGGKYTKIGNTVTVWAKLRVGTRSSPSGAVNVTGLPYTSGNVGATDPSQGIAIVNGQWNSSTSGVIFATTDSNATTISLLREDGSGEADDAGTYMPAIGDYVYFSVTYRAA